MKIDNKTIELSVADRLLKIDKIIKNKFSNLWVSVRKAFLDLDIDKDGLVNSQDIMRYFGEDDQIDYIDLRKLIIDKSRSNSDNLNCADFTRWVGESIHHREGFYFRHDSLRNPNFDQHITK